jgi:hypothetical protein
MALLVSQDPAAVQAVADVHDTPARELPSEPLGLGVVSMARAVPFQRSASVTSAPWPAHPQFRSMQTRVVRPLPRQVLL